MTPKGYVPERGDIVWLDFDPQPGHEQGGRRPAVVLTTARYNRRSGLMLCCPITTRIKGYPFEVAIAGMPPSVALADHVKSQDWRVRNAAPKGRLDPQEMVGVLMLIEGLLS